MYIIKQWNGQYDEYYECKIVAGFSTLEEASAWCHKQSPTRTWYGREEKLSISEAFYICRIEGEVVEPIFYPWENK